MEQAGSAGLHQVLRERRATVNYFLFLQNGLRKSACAETMPGKDLNGAKNAFHGYRDAPTNRAMLQRFCRRTRR